MEIEEMRKRHPIEQEDLFSVSNQDMCVTEKISALYRSACQCKACPNWKSRPSISRMPVFDGTAKNPDLFLISEGPGIVEERVGKPFQGPSGKLLDKILRKVGTSREACFLTNVTLCKPLGEERSFPVSVLNACRIHWTEMIKIIEPRIVVTLGITAIKAMFPNDVGTDSTMSQLDGSERTILGAAVISTYHPAYFLRGTPEVIKQKMKDKLHTWSQIRSKLEKERESNEHWKSLE